MVHRHFRTRKCVDNHACSKDHFGQSSFMRLKLPHFRPTTNLRRGRSTTLRGLPRIFKAFPNVDRPIKSCFLQYPGPWESVSISAEGILNSLAKHVQLGGPVLQRERLQSTVSVQAITCGVVAYGFSLVATCKRDTKLTPRQKVTATHQ